MFSKKKMSANDSFLMSANKANISKKATAQPPMAKKKPMTVQTKNPHPASPRQKLGAIGIAK